MLARLLFDYGILMVLMGVCAYFSVATLAEQHPEGVSAAVDLAPKVLKETRPGDSVIIAARDTPDDAAFAKILAEYLVAQNRRIAATVLGQPDAIAGELAKLAKTNA